MDGNFPNGSISWLCGEHMRKSFLFALPLLLAAPFVHTEGHADGTKNMPAQAEQARSMTQAGEATITAAQARECIRKRFSRFLQEISEEHLSFRVGDIVAETPDAYIIEGYLVLTNDAEEKYWGAVHKVSGKCGLIHPPFGPRITPEFLSSFSWDRWQVSF